MFVLGGHNQFEKSKQGRVQKSPPFLPPQPAPSAAMDLEISSMATCHLCHWRCEMCRAPPKLAFNDQLLSTAEKLIMPLRERELSELG